MKAEVSIDPHFNSLLRNALHSMLIMSIIIIVLDVMLLMYAPLNIGLILSPAIIFGAAWYPIMVYGVKLHVLNTSVDSSSQYIVIALVSLTLSFIPIALYALLGEDWSWLTDFGFRGLGVAITKGGLYLPVLLYGFIVMSFLMTVRYIKTNAQNYKLCNEKRTEFHG